MIARFWPVAETGRLPKSAAHWSVTLYASLVDFASLLFHTDRVRVPM